MRRIGEAIANARHSVWLTVAFYSDDFLVPDGQEPLFDILDRAVARGVDVRLLIWRPNPETAPSPRMFGGSAEHRALLDKRGSRFKIRWDQGGDGVLPASEELGDRCRPAVGDILRGRPQPHQRRHAAARRLCRGDRAVGDGRAPQFRRALERGQRASRAGRQLGMRRQRRACLCRPCRRAVRAEHGADPAHARSQPLCRRARRAIDPGAVPARDRCGAPHDLPPEPGHPDAGGRPPSAGRRRTRRRCRHARAGDRRAVCLRGAPRSAAGGAVLGHRDARPSREFHPGRDWPSITPARAARPTCTPR